MSLLAMEEMPSPTHTLPILSPSKTLWFRSLSSVLGHSMFCSYLCTPSRFRRLLA